MLNSTYYGTHVIHEDQHGKGLAYYYRDVPYILNSELFLFVRGKFRQFHQLDETIQ